MYYVGLTNERYDRHQHFVCECAIAVPGGSELTFESDEPVKKINSLPMWTLGIGCRIHS